MYVCCKIMWLGKKERREGEREGEKEREGNKAPQPKET